MVNILIRDLPDDVHAELQRRVQARGQSLRQYLAGELTRITLDRRVKSSWREQEDGALARDVLGQQGEVCAPDLVDVETVAVLRKRCRAGTLSDRRFAEAVEDLQELPIDRYPTLPLMWRAYELRDDVTAYDATYVALAEALDRRLVTGDVRLSGSSGIACAVRVLQVGD